MTGILAQLNREHSPYMMFEAYRVCLIISVLSIYFLHCFYTKCHRGSSGSPLFDGTTHRIIGQLYGGYAACGNEDYDVYGRFDMSFVNGLKLHLDPSNTGTQFVDTFVK